MKSLSFEQMSNIEAGGGRPGRLSCSSVLDAWRNAMRRGQFSAAIRYLFLLALVCGGGYGGGGGDNCIDCAN